MGLLGARAWTEREQALVRAIARGLAVTLERTETTRQLAENARAQEAFVAFTEAVGTETDLLAVVRQAIAVLRDRFMGGTIAYYTRDGDLWKAQAWSEDMSEALIATVTAGLPSSTPLIRHALEAGTAVFTGAWDSEREQIEHTEEYGTAAASPLTVNGEVGHLLLFGLKNTPQWTERDRALIRAVGRGLTLALKRAEQTRRLEVQNAELDARTRALEGFAALTQNLTAQDDPRAFVRRAQEVVMTLLPPGYARYFEPEAGRWRSRVQVGDDGNAALQAHCKPISRRGSCLAQPPASTRPGPHASPSTRTPTPRAAIPHTPAELVGHVNATASLPVLRHGEVVGVFAVVLFEARAWTPTDRVVLETVVRSLGGALERAEATRDLTTTQMRLRAMVDNAPLVLFALDREGTFTLSEGRGLAGLGLTPGQAVGHSADELYGDTPELLDDLRLALGGQEVHQTRRIGDRVFESWTIPVKDASGAVTDLVGVSTDVTERRQVEQDLARSNEELRRSNAELEQFAYIASHDLQAPIRAVTSFAGVIDKRSTSGMANTWTSVGGCTCGRSWRAAST